MEIPTVDIWVTDFGDKRVDELTRTEAIACAKDAYREIQTLRKMLAMAHRSRDWYKARYA